MVALFLFRKYENVDWSFIRFTEKLKYVITFISMHSCKMSPRLLSYVYFMESHL